MVALTATTSAFLLDPLPYVRGLLPSIARYPLALQKYKEKIKLASILTNFFQI